MQINKRNHIIILISAIFVFCVVAAAETQKEKDLKAQLAAEQQTQTQLGSSVGRLTSSVKRNTVAAETAAQNAETAKEAATLAADKAVAAADRIEAKIEILQKVSQQGTENVLITEVAGFLVVLVGLVFKAVSDYREHNWAKEAASQHKTELEEVKTEARQAYVAANHFNAKLDDVTSKLDLTDK